MRQLSLKSLIPLVCAVIIGPPVLAFVADSFSMQGVLTDDLGNPVADGTHTIEFSVWDALSGGTQRWSETQVVTTVNGHFNIYLGSVNPIDQDVFGYDGIDGEAAYLEIKVEADPPMTRTLIGGSPLAFTSARVKGELLRTETNGVVIGKDGQDALVVIAQPAPLEAGIRLDVGATPTTLAELKADATGGTLRIHSPTYNDLTYVRQQATDLGVGMTFFQAVSGLGEPIIDIHSDAGGGTITLLGPDAGKAAYAGGPLPLGAATAVADASALNAYMELISDVDGGRIKLIGQSPLQPEIDLGADPTGGHVRIIGNSPLQPFVDVTADSSGGHVMLIGGSPLKPFVKIEADGALPKICMGAGTEDYFAAAADSDSVCLAFLLPGVATPNWGLCANFSQGTMEMTVPVLSIIPPGPESPEFVLYDVSLNPRVTMDEDGIRVRNAGDLAGVDMINGCIQLYNSSGLLSAVFEPNGVTAPSANFGSSNTKTGVNTFVAGNFNDVNGNFSTVGGGTGNTASGGSATVAGGIGNDALFGGAFVGGGNGNTASGLNSTVPGGTDNTASGDHAFAAGKDASAGHDGAFVWSDASGVGVSSDIVNQFKIRASGGTIILSDTTPTAGVRLSKGSSAWQTLSDRNTKANIRAVEAEDILERVARLPIYRWNYKAQSSDIQHVGPMAQDFYALFNLGEDDRHLSTIDPDGVALAAIQALYGVVTELQERTEDLERTRGELEELRVALTALQR